MQKTQYFYWVFCIKWNDSTWFLVVYSTCNNERLREHSNNMQTFLPYPDFTLSAQVLDQKRLGKQRVENLQLLLAFAKANRGLHGGWARHPASRMWKGFELGLLKYQEAITHEWVEVRGYKDTCWEKSCALFTPEQLADYEAGNYELPEWIGDEDFHLRHKSKLVQKAPEIYKPIFGFDIPEDLEYIWPGPSLEEAKLQQEPLVIA
jgi:hypothetical protein